MVYELGDYIGKESKSYFLQCMLMTDFQERVCIDDIIYTYRNNDKLDYIIREYVFKGYIDCNYQGQDSNSCRHCNGNIKVMDVNDNKIIQICPGWASGKESCILKIIKESRMNIFEEKDFII